MSGHKHRSRGLRTRVVAGAVALAGLTTPAVAQRPDSLTLTAALAIGRARSPALAAARAGVRGAEGVLASARSRRLPRVSVDALYLRFEHPPGIALGPLGFLAPIPLNSYYAQVGVQQPIYTSGRTGEGIRAADLTQQSAALALAQSDVEMTAAVAHAHDAVLLARAMVGVAQSAAALLDSAVVVATERFGAGAAARIDVLRAETRRATAQADARAQSAALAAARDRLATILGIAPNELPPVAGALEPAALSLDTLREDALVAAAANARPDVGALRAVSGAAQARARAAKGSLRPGASLFLSSLTTRPELVSQEKSWGTKLYGGVLLSWAVLDFGAAAGEAQAARAEADRADAQARETSDAAVAGVLAQLRELQRAEADIAEGRDNVERARRALTIAGERYADGIGIQLEVLEAQADLVRSQADLLRAIHAHRSAAVELRRAIGHPADASLIAPVRRKNR